jgi:hypothetical protein
MSAIAMDAILNLPPDLWVGQRPALATAVRPFSLCGSDATPYLGCPPRHLWSYPTALAFVAASRHWAMPVVLLEKGLGNLGLLRCCA